MKVSSMAFQVKQDQEEYELRETVDMAGRIHRDFVCHGDLYERNLSAHQRTVERYAGVLLSAAAVLFLALAMMRNASFNKGASLLLPVLCLLPASCVHAGAWIAFSQKGNLTERNYRRRLILLRVMPFAASALLIILSACYSSSAILTADAADRRESWIAFAFSLTAAAVCTSIGIRELQVGYFVHKGSRPSLRFEGLM